MTIGPQNSLSKREDSNADMIMRISEENRIWRNTQSKAVLERRNAVHYYSSQMFVSYKTAEGSFIYIYILAHLSLISEGTRKIGCAIIL